MAVDKPFEVGDFIVIDSLVGSVEDVGLKTTRIRSLDGEKSSWPTPIMISSTIHTTSACRNGAEPEVRAADNPALSPTQKNCLRMISLVTVRDIRSA